MDTCSCFLFLLLQLVREIFHKLNCSCLIISLKGEPRVLGPHLGFATDCAPARGEFERAPTSIYSLGSRRRGDTTTDKRRHNYRPKELTMY